MSPWYLTLVHFSMHKYTKRSATQDAEDLVTLLTSYLLNAGIQACAITPSLWDVGIEFRF